MKTWFIFLSTLAVALAATIPHPLSDEAIAQINAKQSTWIAGRNFDINTPWSRIQRLASGVRRRTITNVENAPVYDEDVEIPVSFDARDNWPNCESIPEIRDQSGCGSCWAFGAVEAMSDRICIATSGKKQLYISAEDLNSCCKTCGDGCDGGDPYEAWNYWYNTGIVTGGLYNNTQQGCKSYSLPPCEHHTTGSRPSCSDFSNTVTTPACTKTCDDASESYENSKTYGLKPYNLVGELNIQVEILTNGPVEADFIVYEDFLQYKSGVYQHTSNQKVGGHAIKILGWGVENDVKYWLAANSWNSDWGDNGYFKILRGANECEIEDDMVAALPDLDKLNL